MKLIKSIEITKFRSIYKSNVRADHITILSGKNNSGKSNVLKALNLFFNGRTNYDTAYDHDSDFNLAYTGGAGNKREIFIRVSFYGSGKGKLRDDFSISRSFLNGIMSEPRYESTNPEVMRSIHANDGNTLREFTRFYHSLNYIYVPAIRDKSFIKHLFILLERAIDGSSKKIFDDSLASLNEVLEDKSRLISKDFKSMLGLDAYAKLSTKQSDILEAIGVDVDTGIKVFEKKTGKRSKAILVDLFSTGDGVLMSYIPHFLAYISRYRNYQKFIWGFEEPENSLEYGRVQHLASKFQNDFSQTAQIFLTTHSPAFIELEQQEGVELYRVYIEEGDVKGTSVILTTRQLQQRLALKGLENDEYDTLRNELGMAELAKSIEQRIKEVQGSEGELRKRVDKLSRPVVYSEGRNLVYLEIAKKIFDPKGKYSFYDGGGKTELKTMYEHIKRSGSRYRVAIVWDPECASYESLPPTSMVLPKVLSKYKGNLRILKGIESCFSDNKIVGAAFYRTRQNDDGGTTDTLRKDAFERHFCVNPDPKDFLIFKPVIEEIGQFFSN